MTSTDDLVAFGGIVVERLRLPIVGFRYRFVFGEGPEETSRVDDCAAERELEVVVVCCVFFCCCMGEMLNFDDEVTTFDFSSTWLTLIFVVSVLTLLDLDGLLLAVSIDDFVAPREDNVSASSNDDDDAIVPEVLITPLFVFNLLVVVVVVANDASLGEGSAEAANNNDDDVILIIDSDNAYLLRS